MAQLQELKWFDSCLQEVKPKELGFDLDVACIKGYQLFAFSCSTDSTDGLLKSKLFEVAHRAEQLGGREAVVVLVSASDCPQTIEKQLRNLPVRAKVFGRTDIPTIGTEVKRWIDQEFSRFYA